LLFSFPEIEYFMLLIAQIGFIPHGSAVILDPILRRSKTLPVFGVPEIS